MGKTRPGLGFGAWGAGAQNMAVGEERTQLLLEKANVELALMRLASGSSQAQPAQLAQRV